MFHKILVPVDLTDRNARAVEIATRLVAGDGSITLFHVIATLDVPFDELHDFYRGLEAQAAAKIAEAAEAVRAAGTSCDTHVAFGKPAPEIVSFANGGAFDLVVIASHPLNPDDVGRGFMTVSHQVAIAANIPVLAVK